MTKRQRRRRRWDQKRIDANMERRVEQFCASTPLDAVYLDLLIAQSKDATTWAAIASNADPLQDLAAMQRIMARRRFPAMSRDPDPIKIEAPSPVSFEIHVTSDRSTEFLSRPFRLHDDNGDRPTDGTYSAAVDRISDAMKKFAPCQGCRFFHGGVYGAELLVCAVHPYGMDGAECPDYEASEG